MTKAELNERLAKSIWPNHTFTWAEPALSHMIIIHQAPDWIEIHGLFTTSMDACIKWIVPEIDWFKILYLKGQGYAAIIYDPKSEEYIHHADNPVESMPLAFCLAAIKYFERR